MWSIVRGHLVRFVRAYSYATGGVGGVVFALLDQPIIAVLTFLFFTILAVTSEFSNIKRNEFRDREYRHLTEHIDHLIEYALSRPFHIRKSVYSYTIGLSPGGDSFRREYTLTAFTEEEMNKYIQSAGIKPQKVGPVYVAGMEFGAMGEGVSGRKFEDLDLRGGADQGTIDIIPSRVADTHIITVHVLFRPEIEPGTSRTFWIEGRWWGIWNPLRAHGEDYGALSFVHYPHLTDKIEIRVVSPPYCNKEDVILIPYSPKEAVVPIKQTLENERWISSWEILKPEKAKYLYKVQSLRLKSNWQRIYLKILSLRYVLQQI